MSLIYNDLVRLCGENPDMKNSDNDIELLCRTLNLSFFHMDNLHTDTINELNVQAKKIINKSDPEQETTIWETNEALTKQISHYNFELPLGSLKQKTPYQAMEAHYTQFPNSFKHKPMASFNISCL